MAHPEIGAIARMWRQPCRQRIGHQSPPPSKAFARSQPNDRSNTPSSQLTLTQTDIYGSGVAQHQRRRSNRSSISSAGAATPCPAKPSARLLRPSPAPSLCARCALWLRSRPFVVGSLSFSLRVSASLRLCGEPSLFVQTPALSHFHPGIFINQNTRPSSLLYRRAADVAACGAIIADGGQRLGRPCDVPRPRSCRTGFSHPTGLNSHHNCDRWRRSRAIVGSRWRSTSARARCSATSPTCT